MLQIYVAFSSFKIEKNAQYSHSSAMRVPIFSSITTPYFTRATKLYVCERLSCDMCPQLSNNGSLSIEISKWLSEEYGIFGER